MLLTLKTFSPLIPCFYCWLSTGICLMGSIAIHALNIPSFNYEDTGSISIPSGHIDIQLLQ